MERIIKWLKSKSTLIFLYVISIVLALLLLVVIGLDHNYTRKNYRSLNGLASDSSFTRKIIDDDTAPMGMLKVYTKKVEEQDLDRHLCFYTVHNYIKVYVDDDLIFELYPDEEGTGKTIGCDWAFVPIVEQDLGKTLKVEVTPVYKIAVLNEIEFIIGDGFSVFLYTFHLELPAIILCLLICVLGVILFIISAINSTKLHLLDKKPLLIGIFSIIMGVWKMLDTKLAPLIFFGEPKIVYYLSVTVSFVGGATLALYLNEILGIYKNIHKKTKALAYFFTLFSIAMLLMQLFNIRDLRENLSLMHFSLVMFALISSFLIYQTKKIDGKCNKEALQILLIMSIGFGIDLVIFQITRNSDYLYFSFLAFFIYAIIVGVKSISKRSVGMYLDLSTGLFNKSYCTKIIDETIVTKGTVAAVMIDLNDLKITNDIYGHEEGDKLILDFTSCIKNFNNQNSIVGRFGGDEFVILMRKTSEEYVKVVLANLEYKVAEVNKTRGDAKISYAKGYAIANSSNETMYEILNRADQKMYENKVEMKKQTKSIVR